MHTSSYTSFLPNPSSSPLQSQITLDGLNLGLLAELPLLRTLYLQSVDRSMANPACKKQGYREAVLGKLATLSNLDGVRWVVLCWEWL